MTVSEKIIGKIIGIVESHPDRPKDSYGNPGGLIDFSGLEKPIVVIGDLHGSIENLKAIMGHKDNINKLEAGELQIIILGDGIHNDQTGRMLEMDSSLLVLEEVYRLIETYADRVIYIRGNHDTFEERLAKSSIKQGLEFKNYLLEHRGQEYVEATERSFESLPVFIIGKGYVITHALDADKCPHFQASAMADHRPSAQFFLRARTAERGPSHANRRIARK